MILLILNSKKLNKAYQSNDFAERKEKEINYLNNEIQNLKQVLNSYQNQNTKIMELETKLKMQKMKYERKIKSLDELYLNQIDVLAKKNYLLEKSENPSSYYKEKRSNGRLNNLDQDNDDFSQEVIEIFLFYYHY